MSLWLAFDAGSPVTSAAVARDGALLAESSGESRTGPSLLHQIDASLRRAAIATADLDGIVVLSGPGSFTGIRVALATALGFRAGLAVPVVALSNLAALAIDAAAGSSAAETASAPGERVVALVDALRDEWFVQEFERREGGLVTIAEPARQAVAQIAPPAGALLAAHATQPLPARFAEPPVHRFHRASALCAAVAVAASAGTIDDLVSAELRPLYLRGFTPRNPGR